MESEHATRARAWRAGLADEPHLTTSDFVITYEANGWLAQKQFGDSGVQVPLHDARHRIDRLRNTGSHHDYSPLVCGVAELAA